MHRDPAQHIELLKLLISSIMTFMNEARRNILEMRVRAALEALYEEFAGPVPAVIEGCQCCIATRGVDILLTTPLRELSGEALWRYVSGAFYTIGSEEDFRYFLPRIFEISVIEPFNANNPEIVLKKLGLANWQSWSSTERRAIEEFVDSWFERALDRDLADTEDGFVGWDAESVLCGAALANFSLDRWLLRLHNPIAAPVLADLKARYPRELSAFWKEVPDGLKQLATIMAQGEA